MRPRIVGLAAALAASILIAAAFYRWPARSDWMLPGASATGLTLAGAGAPSLSLAPWPALHYQDVVISDGGRKFGQAKSLKLQLSLAGLLRGEFLVDSATLASGELAVDLDQPPLAELLNGRTPANAASYGAALQDLRLENSVLHILSASRRIDLRFENCDLRLEIPAGPGALHLHGEAALNGRPQRVSLDLADKAALQSGAPSGLAFAFGSGAARLQGSGIVSSDGGWRFTGDAALNIPSIPALNAGLNLPGLRGLPFDRFALAGQTSIAGNTLSLEDLHLDIGGQSLQGAATLTQAAGRPKLSASLAAGRLTIETAPLVAQALADAAAGRATPLRLGLRNAPDFDIRLSATGLNWGAVQLSDIAMTAANDGGVLKADIAQAAAYGGQLKARLNLSPQDNGVAIEISGDIAKANAATLAAALGLEGLSGAVDGNFQVKTQGPDPFTLARNLGGAAKIMLAPFGVDGVSLEEALRRSLRHPVEWNRDFRVGGTSLAKAQASFDIAQGQARIVQGEATGPGLALAFGGQIDLAARRLALQLAARQADADGAVTPDAAALNLEIAGPWTAPVVSVSSPENR